MTPESLLQKNSEKPIFMEESSQASQRFSQSQMSQELVAAALLKEPSVEDCAVFLRKTETSEQHLVAYIVLTKPTSYERLQTHLQTLLPSIPLPITYVPVSAMPLTTEGEIDQQLLANLEVIDTDLINRWETELQALAEIKQAAVILQERADTSPSLHLSDLLLNWKSTPAGSPEDVEIASDIAIATDSIPQSRVPALSDGGSLPIDPEAPATLPEALRQTADQVSGQRIIYLQPDGSEQTKSYRSLLEEAERILGGLRQQGLRPQDKVIFQLELNQDIIPAFWGCILGGFIPVIMGLPPTYEESNNSVDKLCNVWKLLDQPLIITSTALQPSIQQLSQWLPEGLHITTIEALRANEPESSHHVCQPDDVAFFNLTSGSTGMPKCISLTHRNLIARARGTNILCQHDRNDVILNWLPFDHIGSISDWHIRCVILGCYLVYASKEYVLGRPLNWMDLIHQYRITHSWAPNFAYALVNDALKQDPNHAWDLSCVKSLLTAGEAVSSKAVEDFIDQLAIYGFKKTAIRPAFGMAEMGSGITYYLPTEEQPILRHTVDKYSLNGPIKRVSPTHSHGTTFTDLGPVIPGVAIRIVNDQNVVVPEDTIGYLHVKGAAVSPGYYKNPQVNQEVFLADGWFNTGDLGFISNGHLVVTGRAKETIIINGANYYNHEIEAVVEEVDGVEVSYTAACAIHDPQSATEKLAIFFHTACDIEDKLVELLQAIRQVVVTKIGLNPEYLIPVEKAVIPKTAIGKIQRSQLSQRFETGEFDPILKQIDILLGNANTLPNWFYQKIWRRSEAVTLDDSLQAGHSLVFVDSLGLGDCLANHFNQVQQPCICIEAGTDFVQISRDRYRLDPKNPNHYRRLLGSLAEQNLPITQILHLWTYGEYPGAIASPTALEQGLDQGLYSVLLLLQALANKQESEHPVRLLVVSHAAQPTAPADHVAAERAAIAGLVKTASQELPWLDSRHIDLSLDTAATNTAHLLRELKVVQRTPEVAYRKGQRWIPRLQQVDWSQLPQQTIPFKPGGMYLLSGGLGGIGVEIAKYLLQHYQARLLLIGKTPLPERRDWDSYLQQDSAIAQRIQTYQSLEQLDGEVVYRAIDICDRVELQQAVAAAQSRWQCQLDGIIHLAGIAQDCLLVEETRDRLHAVLRPKVLGTWTLHQLLKDQPNALFIAFSSVNSFFGGTKAGAYAAANCFLDAFSHYQRSDCSLQSYCFNWSMWDEVGMSRGFQMKELSRAQGYCAINKQQGLRSMLVGLSHSHPHLFIGLDRTSRNVYRSVETDKPATQALTTYFTREGESTSTVQFQNLSICDRFGTSSHCQFRQLADMPLTETGAIDRDLLTTLGQRSAAGPIEPRNVLERQLAAIWQNLLDIPQIGIRDNFFALGGNSLLAMRLVAEVENAFDQKLPLEALVQLSTIEQLANALQKEQTNQPLSGSAQSEEFISTASSKLPQLSPEDYRTLVTSIAHWEEHRLGRRSLVVDMQSSTVSNKRPFFFAGFEKLLGQVFGPDRPFYLLPGGIIPKDPTTYIKALAACYVDEIRSVQPEGPYILGGYCFGGLVAYEMAQQLQAQGQEVEHLILVDIGAPDPLYQWYRKTIVSLHRRYNHLVHRHYVHMKLRLATHRQNLLALRPTERQKYILERLTRSANKLRTQDINHRQSQSGKPEKGAKKHRPQNSDRAKLWEALRIAINSYAPQPYSGKVSLFFVSEFVRSALLYPGGATARDPLFFPYAGWEKLVIGDLKTYITPGDHNSFLQEPHVKVLAQKLKACLNETNSPKD